MDELSPGSSEKNEETGRITTTPDDQNNAECQGELNTSQQLSDSEENVSLEYNIVESSVDPDQDILIALAKGEGNFYEKDGGNSIAKEVEEFDENLDHHENCSDKVEDIDLDLNENEKYESETSEIIFSENLNDSEISEKLSIQEERTHDSLNSSQEEEVEIFITQDVDQQAEEGVVDENFIAKYIAKEETSIPEVTKQEISIEDGETTHDVQEEEISVIEEMPEKREEEVVSPTLQRANLRFRWAKTIPVVSNDVVFFSSHKREEPLKLTWSEGADCFYSKDMEVPTGIYKGTLVVDQKPYPVEDITVKHYTFEADLYIKEDVLEDNFNIGRITTREEVNNYGDLNKSMDDQKGLHYSDKIEDVIRQQLHSADTDREYSVKSDHGSGRHTPIGDVGMESYQDELNNSLNKNTNASLVEDEIEQSFDQSQHSSKSLSPRPTVEEIIENTLRESRSPERSTQQPDMLADIFSSEGRRIPSDSVKNGYSLDGAREVTDYDYQSPTISQSLHSSARQTPQKDYIGDILGSEQPKSANGSVHSFDLQRSPARSTDGSLHGSSRHTPLEDVLGQTASPRGSHGGSTQGSARQTPQQTSAHSSIRHTPQQISDSFRTSQEKLYGLHSSMPGHGGSRPQSLTSEQELTQYFEQSSKSVSEPASTASTKTPTPQQHAVPSPSTTSRPHSTASLPVITTQQRLQAEKRSMTPDNYIRIPGNTTSAATTARPSSRGATPASRTSSRTITPANEEERQFSVDHASQKRIDDLEDTVRNLRKLLSAREQEVHELTDQLNDIKDINKSLQDELEHSRERQSATPKNGYQELERQYSLLSNEKEILAQEVVKLQDHIQELESQVGRNREPDGDTHPRLSSYDPNNPNALQRKIDDLHSQVQDLQEANETAVAELHSAERQIIELKKQNESLHTAQNVSHQDLQAENRRLHEKVSKLWEEGYGDGDHKVRVENQQLRDDNRAIRERNYKLHEENIKLKEELTEIRRVLERQTVDTKMSRINAGSLERDQYLTERSKLPTVSIDKPAKTSLTILNGQTDYRPSLEKDGHRYSYRQLKDEKLYTGLTEKDGAHRLGTQKDDSKYIAGVDISDPHFKGSLSKEDYSYKSSYNRDSRNSRDIDGNESRFRSSLEKAEAKLRSSLEKNSYLDRISRYDTKSTETSKSNRSLDRSYESQTTERLKPESYRSMPDGISEKDDRLPSKRYDLTPERLSSSKLDHKSDYEKKTDYNIESRGLASIDRDYKTLTASYPELTKLTPEPDRTRGLNRAESYKRDECIMSNYSHTHPRISSRMTYPTHDYYERDYDNYSYDRKYNTSYQSDGNDSDTATDILVSAPPYEQRISPSLSPMQSPDDSLHGKYHRRSYSQRRDSLGSNGSSIEDVEESYNRRLHNRSKSADGRELLRRTEPMGSSGRSPTPKSERLSLTTGDPGFRTVTPTVLPTQHNRTVNTGPLTNITSGMRPFAPRTPGDINIEDVVKFSRQGGKLSQGKIKFVGHLPGRSDVYLGVELDKEDGKHDGTFEGVRYYKCKPNKGVFVAFNKVVMAWAPNI